MTSEFTNLTIDMTVFDGNLFTETDGIDVEASIRGYCDALYNALAKAYPTAVIDIERQNASGTTPEPLVSYDGQHDAGEPVGREEDLVRNIAAIDSAVYEHGDWYVYTAEEEA